MKLIVFALVLMVALGFRHAHKSQYDLGYEAGMQDAMKVNDVEDDAFYGFGAYDPAALKCMGCTSSKGLCFSSYCQDQNCDCEYRFQ